MNSYNKVILLGNLVRDPQSSTLPRGTACATFSLAVNKKYKGENGLVETVSYIDIVAYGKTAENCGKYLHKGDAVIIDGELRQRRWDDKDTGAKRSKVEVVAGSVNFMPRRNGGQGDMATGGQGDMPDPEPVDEGEIPF